MRYVLGKCVVALILDRPVCMFGILQKVTNDFGRDW